MAEPMPAAAPEKKDVVRNTLKVEIPIAQAFTLFTERIGTWWPATHRIGKQPSQGVVMEPSSGGRLFERDADGKECQWGRVLSWEPPNRVLLAWHLGTDWQFQPDPANASEVEVRFFAESPSSTRVELEHRHFERHGAGYDKLRDAVASPGGWTAVLAQFAAAAKP